MKIDSNYSGGNLLLKFPGMKTRVEVVNIVSVNLLS